MNRLIGTLAVAATLAAATAAPASASSGYTITDLGTLGGTLSQALGINDDGVVVGDADTVDEFHAFRWNGVLTDLQTLGGPGSSAEDVNGAGQVVGFSYDAALHLHSFLYTDAGGMVDLNPALGMLQSEAHAINAGGTIVGGMFVAPLQQHPHLLQAGSVRTSGRSEAPGDRPSTSTTPDSSPEARTPRPARTGPSSTTRPFPLRRSSTSARSPAA